MPTSLTSPTHQRIALAREALDEALKLLDGQKSRLYETALDALEDAEAECARAVVLQVRVLRTEVDPTLR